MTRFFVFASALLTLLILSTPALADIWYQDLDGDGFGNPSVFIDSPTQPGGYVADGSDCNDEDNTIYPGAPEYPGDFKDSDCDGQELCYVDGDNDGWSINGTVVSGDVNCNGYGESSYLSSPEDCDDSTPWIYPGAPETVGDGIDADCDGAELCYADQDNDGWSTSQTVSSADGDCDDLGEAASISDPIDCDDFNETVFPGAMEVCDDFVDQDCDGQDLVSIPYYNDTDGDGFGDGEFASYFCTDPGPGLVLDDTDCDDNAATTYPGAPEICGDMIDNDCDLEIDEGCTDFIILEITDVGNDQGRQLRLTWRRIEDDAPGVGDDIVGYDIYRRIDANKVTDSDKMWPPGDWDFLKQVPTSGEESYNTVVPSLCDSTEAGTCWSIFFLRARTTSTLVFHDTPPDSGYSIDNLAPAVPLNVNANYAADGVALGWDESEDADFNYFRVYRGTELDFAPEPSLLVHETTGTSWTDPVTEGWNWYYRLTAVDFAGNESGPGSPYKVTGVNLPVAHGGLALYANVPNPFNPTTTIHFELPGERQVRLEVFTIDGRRVTTLLDARCSAGGHRIVWDGRTDGGRQVASGSYFYRLMADDQVLTRRMTMLK